MASITWKNVGGASAAGAAGLLNNASNSFGRANQGIQDLSKQAIAIDTAQQEAAQQQQLNSAFGQIAGLDAGTVDAGAQDIAQGLQGATFDTSGLYQALADRRGAIGREGTRELTDLGLGLGNQQKQFKVDNQQSILDLSQQGAEQQLQIGDANLVRKNFDNGRLQTNANAKDSRDAQTLRGLVNSADLGEKKVGAFDENNRLANKFKSAQIGAQKASAQASRARASRTRALAKREKISTEAADGVYSDITTLRDTLTQAGHSGNMRNVLDQLLSDPTIDDKRKGHYVKAAKDLYGTNAEEKAQLSVLEKSQKVVGKLKKSLSGASDSASKLSTISSKELNLSVNSATEYAAFKSTVPTTYIGVDGNEVKIPKVVYNKMLSAGAVEGVEFRFFGGNNFDTAEADRALSDILKPYLRKQGLTPQ